MRRGVGVRWQTMRLIAALTSVGAIIASFGLMPPGGGFCVQLAFLCTAPGTALTGMLDGGSERVSPVLTLASGLALGAILAELMLALGAWQPGIIIPAFAAVCLVALLWQARHRPLLTLRAAAVPGLASARKPHGAAAVLRASATHALAAVHRLRAAALLRGAAPHLLLLGLALAGWVYALENARLSRISGFGLLPALPLPYYLALGALCIGFALAIAKRSSPLLLALYILSLVLMLHGSTAILYSEPRFAWTYKHIGVASYISHFGATDRSIDIYQNWPGFFGLAAALQSATKVSLLAVAPWSEVFFECAFAGAVVFVLRGLTKDSRVLLTAAWLFVLANWLGQDYFAPQSFAYLLSLTLIGVCVRCAPLARAEDPRGRLGRRWWGWLRRRASGRRPSFEADDGGAPLRPPGALLVGGILFVAIVISHQLSPLLCIAAIAAFALSTRRMGLAPLIGMAALEVAWLALAWPLLSSQYHLLEFSPLERPSVPGGNPTWALPGFGYSVLGARLSAVAVCLLAAVALWRRRRAGYFDLPLVAVMLAPALVLGVQPYSGEGLFRVYMFALPWLCFLVASLLLSVPARGRAPAPRGSETPAPAQGRPTPALGRPAPAPAPAPGGPTPAQGRPTPAPGRPAPAPGRPAPAPAAPRLGRFTAGLALAVVSALLGASFLFASFGREAVDYVSPSDVAVELAYERDAPRGSAVLYLAPNVPNRMTWRYAQKQVWAGSFSPSLTEDQRFAGHAPGVSDLGAIESKLRSLQASEAYVMIGPSQIRFVEAYGLLAPGSVESLETALRASSNFELIARDGGAMLFKLRSGKEQ